MLAIAASSHGWLKAASLHQVGSEVLKGAAVAGERDLKALLRDIKPEMQEGVFVFCTIAHDGEIPAAIHPLLMFREREGTTLVMRREQAERAGLSSQFASRLITLTVHSSLNAVGFLAAITARLAEAGISVNAVSAFYHDHLFVPDQRAGDALRILNSMSAPEPRTSAR
ncbi:conserved hypothetical protein [Bradyrhizobium sp. STM 3843]|nr:conserved hypothetical protein [Bradyrhizobium sp. STM 3843]